MATFAEFIAETEIELDVNFEGVKIEVDIDTSKRAKDSGAGGWQHFAWSCTLRMPGKRTSLTTSYRMGLGHCRRAKGPFASQGRWRVHMSRDIARALVPFGRLSLSDCEGFACPTPPSLSDVLHALQGDCRCGDMGFEDYCNEFGLDSDSIAQHKVWEACTVIRSRMRSLLGSHYDAFMDATEE